MESRKVSVILCLLLCILIPFAALAADAKTEIVPAKDIIYVNVGKTADIKVGVGPRAARVKGVTYESDDEAIATVNVHGRVTGVAMGNCSVVVTSKYDGTSIKIPVSVIVPAKKITLSSEGTTVRAGETLTLAASFDPADTSVQEATYKSTNPRIATVDEKGVVTGVKAGRVSIVATAADGSNVRGKINLTVVQPVTGVSYKTPHIRVGAAYNGTFTATLQPANATNKKMTWEVDDPSIATVTGDTNRMRIRGQKWGQTKVTGTTEDGGYQVSIVVDIGSLRHAVRITELKIRDGKPRITLKNNSNLNITQVRYQINGYDAQGNPIQMSRKQDMLMGTYEEALAPGGYSQHGMFNFIHKINYPALYSYEMCITGWTTDTGYNNSQGDLLYTYNVSQQNYEWIPNT